MSLPYPCPYSDIRSGGIVCRDGFVPFFLLDQVDEKDGVTEITAMNVNHEGSEVLFGDGTIVSYILILSSHV